MYLLRHNFQVMQKMKLKRNEVSMFMRRSALFNALYDKHMLYLGIPDSCLLKIEERGAS